MTDYPAWGGLGLALINLGFTVVDRFLRVSVATRVGSDTAKLSRTVNRAFF